MNNFNKIFITKISVVFTIFLLKLFVLFKNLIESALGLGLTRSFTKIFEISYDSFFL